MLLRGSSRRKKLFYCVGPQSSFVLAYKRARSFLIRQRTSVSVWGAFERQSGDKFDVPGRTLVRCCGFDEKLWPAVWCWSKMFGCETILLSLKCVLLGKYWTLRYKGAQLIHSSVEIVSDNAWKMISVLPQWPIVICSGFRCYRVDIHYQFRRMSTSYQPLPVKFANCFFVAEFHYKPFRCRLRIPFRDWATAMLFFSPSKAF